MGQKYKTKKQRTIIYLLNIVIYHKKNFIDFFDLI